MLIVKVSSEYTVQTMRINETALVQADSVPASGAPDAS